MTLRAIAALIVIAATSRSVRVEWLPHEQVRLGNGLHVVLAPDATASSVSVHVRYGSGAASERAGEAGYTHLLEVLLGEGSVHVKDFAARIEATGGWATATSTSDSLSMTAQVPAHALELVLWLEAERMAGLADGITDAGVQRARERVHAEWRAAYVDDPYALVAREVQRALWTGVRDGAAVLADVEVTDVDHVRRFARERLIPNHATIVIAGRFTVAPTRKLVERYFGWIPARDVTATPARDKIEPLAKAVTKSVTDPVPKVVVAFRCEPFVAGIDVVGHMLAGGPSSRLARALVDTGLASEVHVEVTRQHAAELRLVATPAPGVDPARVAAAMHAELAHLRAQPPSHVEIQRATEPLVTDFFVAIENLSVRAELLASWIASGRKGSLASDWPRLLRDVSKDDFVATVARWLGEHAAVTVIGRSEGT